MSVLLFLFEVIGGEGVRIYSGDTAKTGHLPFKKIPEPGLVTHLPLFLSFPQSSAPVSGETLVWSVW